VPESRSIDDLPYYAHLEAEEGVPEEGDRFDTALFQDLSFEGVHAGNLRFLESAFTGVDFDHVHLRRSRFNDVWVDNCRMNGADFAETSWLDAEFGRTVLGGTALFDSKLNRVGFFGCKLVGTNLRNAELRDVTFTNCVMQDVDFAEAVLTNVGFPGSRISSLHVDGMKAENVDLRGASEIGIQSGYDSLAGVRITDGQLLQRPPALAQALGLILDD
jgi:uncharacterized protein YjbI with pentapeptide repeats